MNENQQEITSQNRIQKESLEVGLSLTHIPADRVRSDLAIEKWPAIWRPANSRGEPEVRTLRRSVTRQDGTSSNSAVEVGFTQLGNLTTEDQKTYYGLLKQWQEKGRPSDYTFFSIRKLAKILKKPWGTNVIDATTESLRRLRTTPFVWTNSYHDSRTGEEMEILDTFTIISELKIVRRKSDGHVTKESGYFRFHDMVLSNLLANHTKPVLLDVILNFRSEIAQLLYGHLDLMLARRDQYERRTKELFEDLGLHGSAYRNRSDRKRKLERAITELRGAPLSTGVIASASVQKTKDSKDYKIVFRKTSRASLSQSDQPREGSASFHISLVRASGSELTRDAAALVSYFHRVFHRVENAIAMPREIAQAISLIAQHGFVRAKYVVDFSYGAAEQTNYSPHTFGGILHYVSRALADFDYYERLREIGRRELVVSVAQEEQDRTERTAIDESLRALSEEAYKDLYETTRAEFASRFPSAMAAKPSLFEFAIKAKMAETISRGEPKGRESLNPAA